VTRIAPAADLGPEHAQNLADIKAWRDIGGKQERELSAMYRAWAKQTAVEWPFTSRLLERISQTYDRDAAVWHDTNWNLRKRLS
jgi:hypothetical protein